MIRQAMTLPKIRAAIRLSIGQRDTRGPIQNLPADTARHFEPLVNCCCFAPIDATLRQ
jgi:hypothetical protein